MSTLCKCGHPKVLHIGEDGEEMVNCLKEGCLCRIFESAQREDTEDQVTPEYYAMQFKGIKLDPYRVIAVYQNITHPSHQHAVKKLLRAGQSIKSLKQDINEVIKSLRRWLEMIEEDEGL